MKKVGSCVIVIGSIGIGGCTAILGDFTVGAADAGAADAGAPDATSDAALDAPAADVAIQPRDAAADTRAPDADACTPESDTALCTRLGKNCGAIATTDNCGASRRVASCGACAAAQTCGAHLANVCGDPVCAPETDTAFCARYGKNCGQVTNLDNCGASRTATCGTCTSPQSCGAVTTNVCGCVPESDTAFCARLGRTCNPATATDNCGASRTVATCGTCGGTGYCTNGGTCYDVAAQPGLVLWLEASMGTTAPFNHLSTWRDQSTFHNDAVQPTSAARPIHGLGPCPGFNGARCVDFDGATQYLTIPDSASLELGQGDFLIEVVVATTSATGNIGALFGKTIPSPPYAGPALYVNGLGSSVALASLDANDQVGSSVSGINDGTARVVGMWRHETFYVDARVDGTTASAALATVDVSAPGAFAYIGASFANGNVSAGMTGQIAEIIAIKGTVSASSVAALEGYLKGKYATR